MQLTKEARKSIMNEVNERFQKYGSESLLNYQLVEIVLGKTMTTERIQQAFSESNIKQFSTYSVHELQNRGLTESEAKKVNALFELARQLEVFTEDPKRKITSPRDVYTFMYPYYREQKKEIFKVLYLDTKNQILKEEVISIGSLNASIVHPREVFKVALALSSASIIMCHNHPSGDPTPSREDILITEKLVNGGEILGVSVLDHVIIGDGRYISLKDEGFVH